VQRLDVRNGMTVELNHIEPGTDEISGRVGARLRADNRERGEKGRRRTAARSNFCGQRRVRILLPRRESIR